MRNERSWLGGTKTTEIQDNQELSTRSSHSELEEPGPVLPERPM